MNVGLPGGGLGGIFYILTALLMPVWELIQTLRTGRVDAARWRVAGAQAALALGVLAGLWGTAWCANLLVPDTMREALLALSQRTTDLFGVLPALITVCTLAGVLLFMEAWACLSRPRTAVEESARRLPAG